MSSGTYWIGLAFAGSVTVSWVLVVLSYFATPHQAGRKALARYITELELKLRLLRRFYPAARILWGQVALALSCIIYVTLTNNLLALLLLLIVAWGPKVQLERLVARRVAEVEALVEPWLNAVANALKASPSLGEAIACSASLVPSPMSEEVDLLVKEYEFGTALDRALERFATRIGSRTLGGAVLALQIARNSGGNLPETLENAAGALRELARLEGVVRTKTAEGKAQAFVIGAIPVPMVAGIHQLDSHFFDALWATFAGHVVIGTAVVLWLLAIVLSLRILAVDI
jgi:tight adherence protein B